MLMKSPESGFKWWRIRQDVFETQLAEGCVEVRVACDGFEPEDGGCFMSKHVNKSQESGWNRWFSIENAKDFIKSGKDLSLFRSFEA